MLKHELTININEWLRLFPACFYKPASFTSSWNDHIYRFPSKVAFSEFFRIGGSLKIGYLCRRIKRMVRMACNR